MRQVPSLGLLPALLLAAGLHSGCAGRAVDPSAERVLFVGNSLTYVNDLPGMVAELSESSGTPIVTGMVAEPNVSLEEHWNGRALREIRSGKWDVVVMQQGPSSLDSSRVHLVEWSVRMAEEIRKAGAEPVLMTVWPSSQRIADLPRVIESYGAAAAACSCRLIPAGEAWMDAMRRSGDRSLYGSDGFHPSREGTLLAALTAWSVITGSDPDQAVLRGTRVELSSQRRELFNAAVRTVIN